MPSKRFASPAALARHFALLEATADIKLLAVAKGCMENTRERIHETFGDEELLTALQPTTIAQKSKAGYLQPTAPLIATGELRDSFVEELVPTPYGFITRVGTSDPKMEWHEIGSDRLPPRPVVAIGSKAAFVENIPLVRLGAKSIATNAPAVVVPRIKPSRSS